MATTYYEIVAGADDNWEVNTYEDGTFVWGEGFAKRTAILNVTETETTFILSGSGGNVTGRESTSELRLANSLISVPSATGPEDLYNQLSSIIY